MESSQETPFPKDPFFRAWVLDLVSKHDVSNVPMTPDPNTSAEKIAIQMGGVSWYNLVYILFSSQKGAYFYKSIEVEMGGVSRYFSEVWGSGVDFSGPKKTMTATDVTGLRPEIGRFSPHFGAISLLNYTVNLEKRETNPLDKIQKSQ